jgi:predicted aminopeptidase
MTKGKDNQQVLSNIKVPKDHKRKVRLIGEYKKYFYSFWNKKPTQIYSKTTFLDQEAVTYLVIRSYHNKVEPLEECFPFMGCFPYLGFFKKSSAFEYSKKAQKEGHVSFVRPVYAYSTLGYLDDHILSSFFYYNDIDLAELIFHELFHTILFIKNEVEMNENLANYFAKTMVPTYFSWTKEKLKEQERSEQRSKTLNREIVRLTQLLNMTYEKESPGNKEQSQAVFDKFMSERFKPDLRALCSKLGLSVKNCYPLKRDWNNASLAAFLTYEKKSQSLSALHAKLGVDLKSFFDHIVREYESFKSSDGDKKSFADYLFRSL